MKNYDDNAWMLQCFRLVGSVLLAKFSADQRARQILLDTDDALIVEGSDFDSRWGVGLDWLDTKMDDERNWAAPAAQCNLLGRVLMMVRAELRRNPPSVG